jgi:U1 small nuclear ribonucleoprotein 70kDa
MTDKLPPNLLALFAPRPPLRWVPPCDYPPEQRKTAAIGGVADFLPHLEAYKDADGYVPTESWLQARDRKKLEKKAEIEKMIAEAPKLCESFCGIRYAQDRTLTPPKQSTRPTTPTFVAMPSRH